MRDLLQVTLSEQHQKDVEGPSLAIISMPSQHHAAYIRFRDYPHGSVGQYSSIPVLEHVGRASPSSFKLSSCKYCQPGAALLWHSFNQHQFFNIQYALHAQ